MAAEGPLHELGAIQIVNSDSQGMGRMMETVRRTFQLAHVMKAWRATPAGVGWAGLDDDPDHSARRGAYDREVDWRDAKRLTRLLKTARLKISGACIEDINWRVSRGLDRALITTLAGGDWLRHGRNVLITGATGVGKTWLACALAQQAARLGFSVLYARAPRLLEELRVAHGDGSFGRRLGQLARIDLLALDDFAIAPLAPGERYTVTVIANGQTYLWSFNVSNAAMLRPQEDLPRVEIR